MPVEGIEVHRREVEAAQATQFAAVMRAEKQKVGTALLQQALQRTPVDEGEARRGWHISSPRRSDKDVQDQDPYVSLVKLASEAAAEDPVYINNNVDHIQVLDQGLFVPRDPGPSKDPRPGRTGRVLVEGGFSVQAPEGIVDRAVDTVATEFQLRRIEEGS
jgi:hypothetical protein